MQKFIIKNFGFQKKIVDVIIRFRVIIKINYFAINLNDTNTDLKSLLIIVRFYPFATVII